MELMEFSERDLVVMLHGRGGDERERELIEMVLETGKRREEMKALVGELGYRDIVGRWCDLVEKVRAANFPGERVLVVVLRMEREMREEHGAGWEKINSLWLVLAGLEILMAKCMGGTEAKATGGGAGPTTEGTGEV